MPSRSEEAKQLLISVQTEFRGAPLGFETINETKMTTFS